MAVRYAEVIGDPIAHSKSPLIHRFWLDALGLGGDYRAVHVTHGDLADYVARRRADADWMGCNVTIPHKQAVLALVDDPGGIRATIGAANTLLRESEGRVIATNTDAAGFFTPIAGLDLEGQPAVVIGSGGAAHAVLFALARAGIGPVTMVARNPLAGAGLLSRFGLIGGVQGFDRPLPPARLIVNASPLGMTGQPPLVLDLGRQDADCVVYDLVYAPVETDLLSRATELGLDTVDGLEMLIGQAALAFELFFGTAPPRDEDDKLRRLLLT